MRKHCGNCANHRKETNQFSDECGNCVAAVLENGECTEPSHWREKPQTNADRIRAMSDEELADLLCNGKHTFRCANCSAYQCDDNCEKHCLEWLKQPAEVSL